MSNILLVELCNNKDIFCKLTLPASDYELLDALERLQMKPGDKPGWERLSHEGFKVPHPYTADECDIYQLNALMKPLGKLDDRGKAAFRALLVSEAAEVNGLLPISTLIDLAYSTDCCHVVEGITNDTQLGRFFAEGGFIPELDGLPEDMYQLLDFTKLGKKMREDEGGILTGRGYVSQHTELKHVYDTLTLVPQTPDYAFRLLLDSNSSEKQVTLELPSSEETLARALEDCGTESWDKVFIQTVDSAIPGVQDMDCDGIDQMNELARLIKDRERKGELPKLKAVLQAVDCHDADTAIYVAESLDDYLYEPGQRTAEDIAIDELRFAVDSKTLDVLRKHVNLYRYGMELLTTGNAALTPYGKVERRDGEPLMDQDKPSPGMTMQ